MNSRDPVDAKAGEIPGTLDSPEQRRQMLAHILRGFDLMADTMGIDLRPLVSSNPMLHAMASTWADEFTAADPDNFYTIVQNYLLGGPLDARNIINQDPFSRDYYISPEGGQQAVDAERQAAILGRMEAALRDTIDLPAKALDERIKARFTFSPETNLFAAGDHDFLYGKVAHGFWEKVVHYNCWRNNLPVTNVPSDKFTNFTRLFNSGFFWFFSHILDLHRGMVQERTGASNSWISDQLRLGIHFSNGMTEIDKVRDSDHIIRAKVGSLTLFNGLFPDLETVEIGDGSAPKLLVVQNTYKEWGESIAAQSDLLVYIVPPHLRDLSLSPEGDPRERVIVAPGGRVLELWPVFVPAVLSQMLDILRQGRRVTIIAQCTTMAYPLMVAIKRLKDRFAPDGVLRYFDLGQVPDIALLRASQHRAGVLRGGGGVWMHNYPEIVKDVDSPFTIKPLSTKDQCADLLGQALQLVKRRLKALAALAPGEAPPAKLPPYNKALAFTVQARKLSGPSEAVYQVADFVLSKREDIQGRLDNATQAVRHAPRSAVAQAALSSACLAAGKFPRAEVAAREAIGLVPDHPGYRTLLAEALAAQGRTDEARDMVLGLVEELSPRVLPEASLLLARLHLAAGNQEATAGLLSPLLDYAGPWSDAAEKLARQLPKPAG